MRLGQRQAIAIDDVTVHISMTWGDVKKLGKELEALPSADDNPEPQMVFAEQKLLKHVVAVDGLEDADGKPITKLNKSVIHQLPPRFVQKLFQAIVSSSGDEIEDGQGNG